MVVLRLRGDYLAIVTLAFGEIINSLIINLYVNLDEGRLYFKFLKGRGLPGIPLLAAGAALAWMGASLFKVSALCCVVVFLAERFLVG